MREGEEGRERGRGREGGREGGRERKGGRKGRGREGGRERKGGRKGRQGGREREGEREGGEIKKRTYSLSLTVLHGWSHVQCYIIHKLFYDRQSDPIISSSKHKWRLGQGDLSSNQN